MTIGLNGANTWDRVFILGNLAQVLPTRHGRLHTPGETASALRKFVNYSRIRPEGVFHLGNDDFDIGINLAVVACHQAEDMVGVEMRHHDRAETGGVDAGGLQVFRQQPDARRPPSAVARVKHDGPVSELYYRHRV